MPLSENPEPSSRSGKLSLVLPLLSGQDFPYHEVARFRQILEDDGTFESVEVVMARGRDCDSWTAAGVTSNGHSQSSLPNGDGVTQVVVDNATTFVSLARAGILAATGEYVIVLDVERNYSPETLPRMIEAVRVCGGDLAVAVAEHGSPPVLPGARSRFGLKFVSRFFLGTSDAFSGLFGLRRSDWVSILEKMEPTKGRGSSLVLDMLMRSPAGSVDVPVIVDRQFQHRLYGFGDLRQTKHMLDRRFGNYSRLIQFCLVGASGMVVDLTFYAFFQWVFSLALSTPGAVSSWQLAIAAVLSIGIALVWNFLLNRRLTFNDALKGNIFKQFLTYALGNSIAIVFSLSVRLYLPARFAFFARHRLAAAVVGIITATGISFSTSRWVVFGRRRDAH